MGLTCWTRRKKNGSEYTTCLEAQKSRKSLGNKFKKPITQARKLGNDNLDEMLNADLLNEIGDFKAEIDTDNRNNPMRDIRKQIRKNIGNRANDEMFIQEQEEEIKKLQRELDT